MAPEDPNSVSLRVRRLYADLVRGRERLTIAPASEDAAASSPIFVFGLYRSGTTLVRYILDAHSNIACPPESDFLSHLDALTQDGRSRRGLNDLGYNDRHIKQRLRIFTEYFFANYAAAKGKQRWADKTPRYIDHMAFIQSLFPNAQFVMVYRHPLDQIHSFTRGGSHVPWHLEPLHVAGQDPRISAAHYWTRKTQAMHSFEARRDDQCFRLAYENLSVNPEASGASLFRFLHELWEPGVLELSNHRHDRGMEDSKIVTRSHISLATGGYALWPSNVIDEVLAITLPVRGLIGYGDFPAPLEDDCNNSGEGS